MRSYSLSGEPGARRYRISVKREPYGVAGAYIDETVKIGDVMDVSAPRGNFTLRPGAAPVVFLGAGIGATPLMAMLHALAAEASRREVWWLYGTRSGREHPFEKEARTLIKGLARGYRHICYSSPDSADRPGVDFDTQGHLDIGMLRQLEVPHDADFFICGPSAFMNDLTVGLAAWGIAAGRIHTELFGPRSLQYSGDRRFSSPAAAPACRASRCGTAGFIRPERRECPLGLGLSKHS
jgi:ferredoxin-NADP reductase